MENKLTQLKAVTTVVADTGNMDAIKDYRPEDATTNPSLLLNATSLPRYRALLEESIALARQHQNTAQDIIEDACDRLSVLAGREILNVVPGYVSTEVDARLSFDTEATISKARKLIGLYDSAGIDPGRILIKIAATWEGIQAAQRLEAEGIKCNLTLLFGFAQAAACATAGVYLISPFVGRILDWHKQNTGTAEYSPEEDPGVISVTRIYHYYKRHGFKTVVMGASFRNTGEIEQLAGCDKLTISPALMDTLQNDGGELKAKLSPDTCHSTDEKLNLNEAQFRWMMNQDAMATEKLAEGIRNFAGDQIKLEALIENLINQS